MDDGGEFGAQVSASPGDTVESRLLYANDGNAAASGFTLTATVLEGASFVDGSGCTLRGDGGPGAPSPGAWAPWSPARTAP